MKRETVSRASMDVRTTKAACARTIGMRKLDAHDKARSPGRSRTSHTASGTTPCWSASAEPASSGPKRSRSRRAIRSPTTAPSWRRRTRSSVRRSSRCNRRTSRCSQATRCRWTSSSRCAFATTHGTRRKWLSRGDCLDSGRSSTRGPWAWRPPCTSSRHTGSRRPCRHARSPETGVGMRGW